jgi:hypothetical protein
VLGPVSFNSCRLLINLYAKVHNFMIGGLCKTTLASVGNVSPDEGIGAMPMSRGFGREEAKAAIFDRLCLP